MPKSCAAGRTPETLPLELGGNSRELIHIASRIFNTPLLIEPTKLQAILSALGDRLDITVEPPADASVMKPAPSAFHAFAEEEDWGEEGTMRRGRYVLRDGVAVLNVVGTLVHKGAWLGSYSGMTSYDGLSRQLQMISEQISAGQAKALMLNIHSYGGEVAGCFDLVDQLYEMRGEAPIWALVSDAAASAGYAIASAADEVIVTQAGAVGSVGVVLTHYDMTKRAEQLGVAVTHIYAGRDKVLGTPFKNLSTADRRKLQAEVDDLYELFLAKVERNRGMDKDIVRDTEAGMFYAQRAVDSGLADRVGHPRAVFAELAKKVSKPLATRMTEDQDDDEITSPAAAAANDTETVAMTTKSKPAAEATQAAPETPAATDAKGAEAPCPIQGERARIREILSSEEAKERTTLAHHLALETGMDSASAVALLAKSPKEGAGQSGLQAAMGQLGTPGITQPLPSEAAVQAVQINAAAIYENRRKARS